MAGIGIGRIITIVASYFVGVYTGNWSWFAVSIASSRQNQIAKRRERRARQAANDALQDRLEMLTIQPDSNRKKAYGRVRFVEGERRAWSTGANDEILTLVVSYGIGEIDGFEQWYLGDIPVTLDVDGWVMEAPFRKTPKEPRYADGTLDGSGNATITLAETPAPGEPISAPYTSGSGEARQDGLASVSVVGTTATVTGGDPGASVTVVYTVEAAKKFVRVRPYTGAAGQNIGADIAAEYPGKVTADDSFSGMAAVVMDNVFDTDVFPQGLYPLTAVQRGSRVYDPRLDSTVTGGSGAHRIDDPTTWEWSENSALIVYDYARWEFGWRLRTQDIMPPELVAAEADFCDTSTVFTLRKTDGSTYDVTLPRYRCGTVVEATEDPGYRRKMMDELLATMAGSDGWDGGVWHFRAGRMAAAAFTLDESWLALPLGARGKVGNKEPVLRGANAYSRDERVNMVSGKCIDPDQRYQLLPFPAVKDSVLIAAQGIRPDTVTFEAVNHIAHAQHLASIEIRSTMAGLRIEALCNMRAYQAQLFDVGNLRLARQGMDDALGKTAEVVGRTWSPRNRVKLQLAEISEAMFEPDAELKGRDPAPDTSLRRPWDVEALGALTITSGTTALQDGSILTRTKVEWPPLVGANVRQGGEVEIQYIDSSLPLPDGDWPSWTEPGTSESTVIPSLQTNVVYLFRGRAVQLSPLVRGAWTVIEPHVVAAAPDSSLFALDITAAAFNLAADAAGTVGSYAAATATVRVLRAGVDVTSLWTLGKTDGASLTSTLVSGTLSITALSVDSSYVDVSASLSGYATLTQRIPVTKAKGGISVHAATVYIQAGSAPSAPTGGTFNFSTGVLTPPGSWTAARPAVGSDPTYSTEYTFAGNTPGATVTAGSWATPVSIAAGVPTSYIVSPGTAVSTVKNTSTPNTCVSGIKFKTTGAIAKKSSGSSGSTTYADTGEWYHGTPGITYYIRFVQRTLSAGSLSAAVGAGWLALTTDRLVELSATAGVVADAIVDYQIASDSTGGTIVATGTLDLHSEST